MILKIILTLMSLEREFLDQLLFPIHHFDLYRLTSPEDTFELGLEELLPDGISLIEWPDRLGPYMPKDHLIIRMIENSTTRRFVEAVGAGDWVHRLDDLKELF